MPASKQPVFQKFTPASGKGGMFSNVTQISADPLSMALVQDFYVDSGQWVGRDAGNNVFTGLSAIPNSFAFIKYFLGGAYSSRIFFSQPDGKVLTSLGSGSAPTTVGTGLGATPFCFAGVKNRVFCCNGASTPFIVDSALAKYNWGVASQVANLTYTLSPAMNNGGNITVTNGSSVIVGSGGANFNSPAVSAGQSMYILGVRYVVLNVPDATHIILTMNYQGTNATVGGSGTIGSGWQVLLSLISWTAGNGLRYAVSYYNPVTGHTSNISPILDVSDGAPNNDSTRVTINNIVGTNDAQYTKIIIWRSGHGGGILFPRDTINNNYSGGGGTYTDTINTDTILGTVAGTPGPFPAPRFINNPPPADLNFISYWDGRFWGASPSNPGLLYYSARNEPAEVTVGVAEECWPLVNTLPVADSDGEITGTRVVADQLFISTGQKIYNIRGNAPGNYIMSAVSSKGIGGSHFSMTTLPGEDNNSGDVLAHMGNDGKLYFLYGPGGDVSYSLPIQDQFRLTTGPKSASQFVVSMFHSSKGTYVAVGDLSNHLYTYLFDVDRKWWFKMTIPAYALGEGKTQNDGYIFVFADPASKVMKTAFDDSSSTLSTGYRLTTNIQSPQGTSRADNKQLQFVEIVGTNLSGAVVTAVVDGAAPSSFSSSVGTAKQVFTEPNEVDYVPDAGILEGLIFQVDIVWSGVTGIRPTVAQIEVDFTVDQDANLIGGEF
jgi:hypothetical protein